MTCGPRAEISDLWLGKPKKVSRLLATCNRACEEVRIDQRISQRRCVSKADFLVTWSGYAALLKINDVVANGSIPEYRPQQKSKHWIEETDSQTFQPPISQ